MSYISEDFTPWASLSGGIVLGVSTTLYLLFAGRITGMSGILNGVLTFEQGSLHWKSLYVGIMFLCGGAAFYVFPDQVTQMEKPFALSWIGMVLGGFLVGVGTRMSNGCTSGHGVCGISRLSLRSITAVIIFMAAGVMSGTIIHANGFLLTTPGPMDLESPVVRCVVITTGALMAVHGSLVHVTDNALRAKDVVLTSACAALFGIGIVLSGMAQQWKVWGFLSILPGWDPSLMFVMGGAVAVNMVTFSYILNRMSAPVLCLTGRTCPRFQVPSDNSTLDWQLIYGALIFGIGWGVSGICPAPMMVLMGAGYPKVALGYFPGIVAGMFTGTAIRNVAPNNTSAKKSPNENEDSSEALVQSQ